MRILFVSNFYPPHDLGGWEQNCREMADRLRLRGHDCHVLTSRYGVQGQLPPEEGVTRAPNLLRLRSAAEERFDWRRTSSETIAVVEASGRRTG